MRPDAKTIKLFKRRSVVTRQTESLQTRMLAVHAHACTRPGSEARKLRLPFGGL